VIGDAPASRVGGASVVIADALLAACRVGRAELDVVGEVSPRTWDAIDDLVNALIEALPARSRLAGRPLTAGEPRTGLPSPYGPGERTPARGRREP